ncbi:DUF1294 domain-containing protein [Sphingobium sp. Leaf26]|uniref:DUF1294 domain-containing protein n=1 Tax=Sphingobium sp. Leaf26 TaxID=1735693 RepID=UPI001F43911E|nr:DUF1294 domain-containing protein [Sphingobium sp. Leaf26]
MEADAILTILLLAVLLPANLIAFTLFSMDRRHARMGLRRLSERSLLLWALAGGTPGAFLGRHVFRHKTRKQPFTALLWLIAVVQAMMIAISAMI